MTTVAPLQQALDRLFARRTLGIKLGLDPIRALLKVLDSPEAALRAIHVAGTNGKGSVCAIMDAVLRAGGLRVGRTTSPHLRRFNERFYVDGHAITDEQLEALVGEVEPAAEQVSREIEQDPTFFECATAIAFLHFQRCGVDWAILETGLGGRLDATNVVTPLMSVITRIGIDHARMLGDDIATIAAEKCGIIKAGRPVICGDMPEEAERVVRRVAKAQGAAFLLARDMVSLHVSARDLKGQRVTVETATGRTFSTRFPLLGDHQLENLATALATLEALSMAGAITLEDEAMAKGIAAVQWAGRFECLQESPPVILDGAHNPDAAQALSRTLKQVCRKKPVGLITGMCGDKDLTGTLAPLGSVVSRAWIVPIQNPRNACPASVRAALPNSVKDVRESTLQEAYAEALAWASDVDGVVCVAGSLFLVGELLDQLETPPSG